MRSLAVACHLLFAAAAFLLAPKARADTLWTEFPNDGTNYLPVEELSYEIIVDVNHGYDAVVRQRVAIHNAGNEPQDFVLTLATPRATELRGLAIARDGNWSPGIVIDEFGAPASRPSGVVFARSVPTSPRGLKAAEIVGFGLEPGTTTQVELILRAYPTMHGDRWKLDLPRREIRTPNMAHERRIVVRGLGKDEAFYVDDGPNMGALYLSSRAADDVTVAWPAQTSRSNLLDGHVDAVQEAAGDGGKLHLYLRLGTSKPLSPDHVLLLVDRSRSTSPKLARHVPTVLDVLAGALPADTTTWAASFARNATPLFPNTANAPKIADPATRNLLTTALQGDDRTQGTSIEAALSAADAHLATTSARRPLIVIITDGLVPTAVALDGWREKLRARRAEVLFVVDDPILARYGIEPSHPLVDMAGRLGARVTVTSLATLATRGSDNLLAAPKVMGELSFAVGPRAALFGDVPRGLVAGGFVRLEGTYSGKPPRTITVRGRTGGKPVVGRLRVSGEGQLPAALGYAVGHASDLNGGFALPSEYNPSERREALAAVQQSGRGGIEARGSLDQGLIQRYLRTRVKPRASVCYNQALTRVPSVSGRVLFQFEVGKGEVMWATLDERELVGADQKFIACLDDAAWALDIPAGKLDSAAYRVKYPITFTPAQGRKRYELTDDDKVLIDVLIDRAEIYSR